VAGEVKNFAVVWPILSNLLQKRLKRFRRFPRNFWKHGANDQFDLRSKRIYRFCSHRDQITEHLCNRYRKSDGRFDHIGSGLNHRNMNAEACASAGGPFLCG
jgi:hypothetical protein